MEDLDLFRRTMQVFIMAVGLGDPHPRSFSFEPQQGLWSGTAVSSTPRNNGRLIYTLRTARPHFVGHALSANGPGSPVCLR